MQLAVIILKVNTTRNKSSTQNKQGSVSVLINFDKECTPNTDWSQDCMGQSIDQWMNDLGTCIWHPQQILQGRMTSSPT